MAERDPGFVQRQYDANNQRRRRQLAEDPAWAERTRRKSLESQRRRLATPEAQEQRRVYQRDWRRTNIEHVNQTNRDRARDLRLTTLAAYGGRCTCCSEEREAFLVIDHIDGGGTRHRWELEKSRGKGAGHRTYLWLEKRGFPDGFRVLCWNCNAAIAYRGACPHQGS